MSKWLSGLIVGICIGLGLFFTQDVWANYQRLQIVDRLEIEDIAGVKRGDIVVVWDEEEQTNCYTFITTGGKVTAIDCVRSQNF